jgi:hypothetical protein
MYNRTMFTTDLVVNAHLAPLLLAHANATPDDRMTERPEMNHAAWQIGHLALAYDFGVGILTGRTEHRRWVPLFAPGTTPVADRGAYPAKAELIDAFRHRHDAFRALLAQPIDPAKLASENPFEPIRPTLPTVRDLMSYLLTGHLGMHTGQFAAWRRACGIS